MAFRHLCFRVLDVFFHDRVFSVLDVSSLLPDLEAFDFDRQLKNLTVVAHVEVRRSSLVNPLWGPRRCLSLEKAWICYHLLLVFVHALLLLVISMADDHDLIL